MFSEQKVKNSFPAMIEKSKGFAKSLEKIGKEIIKQMANFSNFFFLNKEKVFSPSAKAESCGIAKIYVLDILNFCIKFPLFDNELLKSFKPFFDKPLVFLFPFVFQISQDFFC